jgi:hypothetical protein
MGEITLINDAKLLLQHVQRWEVFHVRRTASEAAHSLSRLALPTSEESVWTEDFPSCVRNIVIAEAL